MTSIIKVLGEPGTAKDTLLRMWLHLLPIKTIERSYLTAAGLRYSPDMQNADLLYIPDSPALQGEMGRQLRFNRSDDGGLTSEYAIRDPETGEMTTKVVTLPIKGLATTSNAITGDVALESGMWTLTTNPSAELTKRVKEEKLKLRAGERPLISDDDLNLWQAVFKVLVDEEPQEIPTVPYAQQLVNLLESERSESRRDPDKLCDLISLVAWMRRFQKEPDKRMEADLIDLYFALQLGLDAMTQTIGELSPKEQQIFEAVEGVVTCRDVADSTKIPYKTCYAYLEKLVDKGYLNQDKEKNRNIYSVLSTEKKPKSFLVSLGRNEDSPEQLLKVVLDTVRNSSTDKPQGEEQYSFIDPLKGCQITVKRNGEQNEIIIDPHTSEHPSPPPYQRRSSEPSKETIPESEKKPKSLLPNENRTEKSLFLYKHVLPGEPCELCGQLAVEWQIKTPQGQVLRRCNNCFVEMRKNLANADWQEETN
jgi:predicted transcriptional regulator